MGAGFILYKENPLQIFTLIPVDKKFNYDLPKGTEDPGETRIETAIRECFEESGIQVPVDVIESIIEVDSGRLTVYIAPWQEGWVPNIQPNPETNKREHSDYVWTTPEEFQRSCAKWLKEAPYKFRVWYNKKAISLFK